MTSTHKGREVTTLETHSGIPRTATSQLPLAHLSTPVQFQETKFPRRQAQDRNLSAELVLRFCFTWVLGLGDTGATPGDTGTSEQSRAICAGQQSQEHTRAAGSSCSLTGSKPSPRQKSSRSNGGRMAGSKARLSTRSTDDSPGKSLTKRAQARLRLSARTCWAWFWPCAVFMDRGNQGRS